MSRIISIKLTGVAETFMNEMERKGLNESDVISQGIGLLKEVLKTERVALIKPDKDIEQNIKIMPSPLTPDGIKEKIIEHYFYVQTL